MEKILSNNKIKNVNETIVAGHGYILNYSESVSCKPKRLTSVRVSFSGPDLIENEGVELIDINNYSNIHILDSSDDDDVTHEYFFGENIKRIVNFFRKK